jgi:hypothetical protein
MNKDMIEYFKIGEMPASFEEFSEKEQIHLEVLNHVFVHFCCIYRTIFIS